MGSEVMVGSEDQLFVNTHIKEKATSKFGSQNAMRTCNWKHTCFFWGGGLISIIKHPNFQ